MKYVSDYKELETKKFDTIEELEAAEKEVEAEHIEKEKAAKEKKADAVKVEDAFKALNAEKKVYNETVLAARKKYNDAVTAARSELDTTIATATEEVHTAEAAYDKALDEFTEKHPEGYHMTLRDGDNVTTISKTSNTKDFKTIGEAANSLLDSIFKGLF